MNQKTTVEKKPKYVNSEGLFVTIKLPSGDVVSGSLWGYGSNSYLQIEQIYDMAYNEKPICASIQSQDITSMNIHNERLFVNLYQQEYKSTKGLVWISHLTLSIKPIPINRKEDTPI